MTERELAEIEARVEAMLATGGWSGDPDVEYDLLRDEVPRLLAEVRALQAQLEAYREGFSRLDRQLADDLLDRALRAGRERRSERQAADERGHESLLEALHHELRGAGEKQRDQ